MSSERRHKASWHNRRTVEHAPHDEDDAFRRWVPVIYDELRRLAHRQRARLRPSQTLDTTALVHETYLKLADRLAPTVAERGHVLAIAARAMRQVLVDYARERGAAKRGGDAVVVPLDELSVAAAVEAEHLVRLDAALDRLALDQPRAARVVECRFFAGLSEAETASALSISLRTVQRDWLEARSWLKSELRP